LVVERVNVDWVAGMVFDPLLIRLLWVFIGILIVLGSLLIKEDINNGIIL
jgi:hypothetical protein